MTALGKRKVSGKEQNSKKIMGKGLHNVFKVVIK